MVSAVAYWSSVGVAAAICVLLCVAARRRPGPWRVGAARVIGLVLAGDAVSYMAAVAAAGEWSLKTSLPLPLCDSGACRRRSVLVARGCWPS
jgi:uncharacterized membrane protein YwaF